MPVWGEPTHRRESVTRIVYGATDCRLMGKDGMPYNVRYNDVWAADDPLVLQFPDVFSAEPLRILRTVLAPEAPVLERAVAAPGIFRRGPGRPKKVVEAEPAKPPDGASQAW
jgi:hypothetical protein